MQPVAIDFETYGIEKRPKYPPKPVGVSIKYPDKPAHYYAWGHKSGCNCTYKEAKDALEIAWGWKGGLLFHHAKFDIDVAEHWMHMPRLAWDQYHDTMLLLFLYDPNEKRLGLKESAERLLNLPPEEQDALADYLVDNAPMHQIKVSRSKNSEHYFARYINYAPGDLTGEYANGDTERTKGIFDLVYPTICERGMQQAYDRERQLLLILLDMERRGVRVDLERLKKDVALAQGALEKVNVWLGGYVNDPSINFDSGAQVVKALSALGKIDTTKMGLTKTGKVKTDKAALTVGVSDKTLLAMLTYRTQLGTCLHTFMEPWLAMAENSGGLIYTTWNQTKSAEGSKAIGTRTGRLSSTPNLQNPPKAFKPIFYREGVAEDLPACPIQSLVEIPNIRQYVIPLSDNHTLLDLDYSQQELRILGHYEDDVLLKAYQKDVNLDMHVFTAAMLKKVARISVIRDAAKAVCFSIIYGSGVAKLAKTLGISVALAKTIKDAFLQAFLGVAKLQQGLRKVAIQGGSFKTLGGRAYQCEKPITKNGVLKTFEYKMLNTLIQGSAADCTKDAIINYYKVKPKDHHLLLTVHDELLISVPKDEHQKGLEILKKAMESVPCDAPFIAEGGKSGNTWADLK